MSAFGGKADVNQQSGLGENGGLNSSELPDERGHVLERANLFTLLNFEHIDLNTFEGCLAGVLNVDVERPFPVGGLGHQGRQQDRHQVGAAGGGVQVGVHHVPAGAWIGLQGQSQAALADPVGGQHQHVLAVFKAAPKAADFRFAPEKVAAGDGPVGGAAPGLLDDGSTPSAAIGRSLGGP